MVGTVGVVSALSSQNSDSQISADNLTVSSTDQNMETPTLEPATQSATPTLILTVTPHILIHSVSTPSATPTPTKSASVSSGWGIKSVSSMKETKDKICGQDSTDFIKKWVDKAVELGANYVSIETPYDNPACGDSVTYAKRWVDAVRSKGLKVWHRHMPLSFEGIYSVSKSKVDFLPLISNYIKNNANLFAPGDIFTPIPEPQNGGIQGITYCAQSLCQFGSSAEFNAWLRNSMSITRDAFSAVGLSDSVKIGYFGFDGFVAWGDNNPDWHGIIEASTISQMGNITIDHYPEAVGDTMDNDLSELEAKYPGLPIIIGEWGTIKGGDVQSAVLSSMGAAKRHKSVVGFNYWHLGMGGNEALINDDFSNKPQFDEVASFFK